MPPILRPRPNVPQHTARLDGRRRAPAATEPQGASNSLGAVKSTRKKKKGLNKPQDQSDRAGTTKGQGPGESFEIAKDSPFKPSGLAPTEQVAKQNETRQTKEQSKIARLRANPPETQSIGLHQESNTRSIKSARVASWVNQVRGEAQPEGTRESKISQLSALKEYVTSTPWYLGYGYDCSDEDMAATSMVSSGVVSKSKRARSRRFELTNPKAVAVLRSRNVVFDRTDEEDPQWINIAMLPNPSATCSAEDEERWDSDFAKCLVSEEAIFQRTIMMELIDRHQLAHTLDYTCESPWTCASTMPQREGAIAHMMPKPRPDLAVAFKSTSILPVFQQNDLRSWRSIMCPESAKETDGARAFHFLSIEAKGASGQIANWTAHRQNLNTATHALHNMYFFMSEAGPDILEAFYKKVRFYSVVATGVDLHVRVHRAVEVPKGRGRIRPDYPLGFVYDVVYHHKGAGYTRAKATGIIRNILIEYGVKILRPLLAQTMEQVCDRLNTLQLSPKSNGLTNEAEAQRSRGRAASRQTRDASATRRRARKASSVQAPNASLTRQELENSTVSSLTPPGK